MLDNFFIMRVHIEIIINKQVNATIEKPQLCVRVLVCGRLHLMVPEHHVECLEIFTVLAL